MARRQRHKKRGQTNGREPTHREAQNTKPVELHLRKAAMVGVGFGLLIATLGFLATNVLWGCTLSWYLYESAWYMPFSMAVTLGFGANLLSQNGMGLSQIWSDLKAKWTKKNLMTEQPQEKPQLNITNDIIIRPPERSFVKPHLPNGQKSNLGTFNRITSYFKSAIAVGLTPNGLLTVARYVPWARGLFEYTDVAYAWELDDLHYFIRQGQQAKAIELIQLAPQDAIDRMLRRKDERGKTPFFNVGLVYRQYDVFKAMFEKLNPEQRMNHLLAFNRIGRFKTTFFKDLVQRLSDPIGENPVWQLIMKNLSTTQKAKLLMSHDQRGDSLFHNSNSAYSLMLIKGAVEGLSKRQLMGCLKEVCPHGTTPLIEAVLNLNLKGLKSFFEILEHQEWLTIMNETPQGWSMTHGQKMLVAAYTSGNDDGINYILARHLKRMFNLTLPEPLNQLSAHEFKVALLDIKKNRKYSSCISKEYFKKEHHQSPEEIFGLETLLATRSYTKAFHRLQRMHHSDKSRNPSSDAESKRLNSAISFIRNPKERKSRLPVLRNF